MSKLTLLEITCRGSYIVNLLSNKAQNNYRPSPLKAIKTIVSNMNDLGNEVQSLQECLYGPQCETQFRCMLTTNLLFCEKQFINIVLLF